MPEYEVCACNLPEDEPFLRAYLECAEWAGIPDELRVALDDASWVEWDAESLGRAREDCDTFQTEYREDLEASGLSDEQAGQDFYLTRNGHGTGFWDRGLGDVGKRLTDGAHRFGETYEDFNPETERLYTA